MTRLSALDRLPQEIFEQIAFYVAASDLGPPSGIVPLICLNRYTYSLLASNEHLYARIFSAKFDTAAAERRLGPKSIAPGILALELQRRCFYLKRLRAQVDAKINEGSDDGMLEELLFQVYLMMLENDGKNELQLREYGRVESWLRIYWFDEAGSSLASLNLLKREWPMINVKMSVAMWLLWFFLRFDDVHHHSNSMLLVLKNFALSAHQYHLTAYPWTNFLPMGVVTTPPKVVYYCKEFRIEPAPLATPAILSFLTLFSEMAEDNTYPTPLCPSAYPPTSLEWECEWNRCVNVADLNDDNLLSSSFRPGSIDGVWEGFFTFTEFRAYAALLAGAPPNTIQCSKVVRHRQTWKLREHHLLGDDATSDSDVEMGREVEFAHPLSPGDPLRSYFPTGFLVQEDRDGIRVQEPGKLGVLHYRRASLVRNENKNVAPKVTDIIITGEGHSAWGQFSLMGRVRPCDGFISVSKDYVDDNRGKWLYRGYLVGDVNGNLAGRWRDTLSPVNMPGYEGCFVMSRRR